MRNSDKALYQKLSKIDEFGWGEFSAEEAERAGAFAEDALEKKDVEQRGQFSRLTNSAIRVAQAGKNTSQV
jgi:hypothetical protein